MESFLKSIITLLTALLTSISPQSTSTSNDLSFPVINQQKVEIIRSSTTDEIKTYSDILLKKEKIEIERTLKISEKKRLEAEILKNLEKEKLTEQKRVYEEENTKLLAKHNEACNLYEKSKQQFKYDFINNQGLYKKDSDAQFSPGQIGLMTSSADALWEKHLYKLEKECLQTDPNKNLKNNTVKTFCEKAGSGQILCESY